MVKRLLRTLLKSFSKCHTYHGHRGGPNCHWLLQLTQMCDSAQKRKEMRKEMEKKVAKDKVKVLIIVYHH
jgi:hypothetical protein